MLTSNHIHLLVRDSGERDVIPNSIQLIAGRTGQEYNQRKNRKGAYWEDRYHATAVEKGTHLIKCLVYMDLNMVRAGVVKHPSEWPFCGYSEIQQPRKRYALVDYEALRGLLDFAELDDLVDAYRGWVEEALSADKQMRDSKWTASIAVGSESFVKVTKAKLGGKAKWRQVVSADGSYELRESSVNYLGIFRHENDDISYENTHLWNVNSELSIE